MILGDLEGVVWTMDSQSEPPPPPNASNIQEPQTIRVNCKASKEHTINAFTVKIFFIYKQAKSIFQTWN